MSEREHLSFPEKAAWWATYGGVVAGLIGAVLHYAALYKAGVVAAVGGFTAQGLMQRKSAT